MGNICSLSGAVVSCNLYYMKRFLWLVSLFVCVPCFCADVGFNESRPYGVSVGFGLSGTSGLNAVVAYHDELADNWWRRHFGFRIDVASTDPLKSAIDSLIEKYMRDGRTVGDGVRIDNGTLDAWHASVMLDYHPFAGPWRVSGGYVWGGASLVSDIFGVVADAPASRFYFSLSGDHYFYDGNDFNGRANIDWNYHGPYIGTGIDIDIFCGFALYLDAGVVVTSGPARLDLDIPHQQLYMYDSETATWSPIKIPALDRDIARAEQDANDDFSKIRLYPMLKMGFIYRF